MENENLNKALHLARGLCWHEWKQRDGYNPNIPRSWPGKDCIKCDLYSMFNPNDGADVDYTSSLEAAFALVEWMRKEKRLAVVIDNENSELWCVEVSQLDSIETEAQLFHASLPTAISLSAARALGLTED